MAITAAALVVEILRLQREIQDALAAFERAMAAFEREMQAAGFERKDGA
jgi:hypothetical protein